MREELISNQPGNARIDSRNVAELLGKSHGRLVKEINKNINFLTDGNIPVYDFYLERSYVDSAGRSLPYYLLTKLGCTMIASKIIGKKRLLFAAACTKHFDNVEFTERAELAAIAAITLDEYKNKMEPDEDDEVVIDHNTGTPYTDLEHDGKYSVTEIALKCGMFSMHGNPHVQAVACILNEKLVIGGKHKSMQRAELGDIEGKRAVYDSQTVIRLVQWLIDNDVPDEIDGLWRTYYVNYIFGNNKTTR